MTDDITEFFDEARKRCQKQRDDIINIINRHHGLREKIFALLQNDKVYEPISFILLLIIILGILYMTKDTSTIDYWHSLHM